MRKIPAFLRAINHVKSVVDGSEGHTTRVSATLPPIRKLAVDAQVSLATMVKAIRTLQAHGVITVVHGKRMQRTNAKFHAVTPNDIVDHPLQPAKLWQSVKNRIAHDIHTGVYHNAAVFPSVKELAAAYSVNYRTIKKALEELRRQDAVAPHGRRYRLPHAHQPRRGDTILVFIHDASESLSLSFIEPSLLRQIETQSRRMGLSVKFVRFFSNKGTVRYINHESNEPWNPRHSTDVLGCLWIVLFTHEVLTDCCRKLLSLGKPVAVMDLTGELLYPPFFFNHPLVRFFSDYDVAQPTRIVGNYLLRLGHRDIALITPWIDQPWAIGRLAGLRQVYTSAGYHDTVKSFTTAMRWPVGKSEPDQGFYGATQRAIRAVARFGASLGKTDYRRFMGHITRTSGSAIDHSLFLWKLALELEPLCAQALQDEKITAWVFGGDEEAIVGLDFLKRHNVQVPGRISVVGFLDTLEALKTGLTSFYHDFEAHIPGILSYLTWPNRFTKLQKNKVTIFDGIVTERRTTGPVPLENK